MLSPSIKIKKFDSLDNKVTASLINLDYFKKYMLEFSNISFANVDKNVDSNDVNIKDFSKLSEFQFKYEILNEEDKFIFCKIYEWDKDKWQESHIATAVLSDKEYKAKDNDMLEIEQQYVGPNDSMSFLVNANPESRYDLKIEKQTFGIKTDKNGRAKIHINPINVLDSSTYSGKFVKKISCSLIDGSKRSVVARVECEYVPESIYALAATNDPGRPGCVIVDPDPIAAFSVSTDPFDAPCFAQPLVGEMFDTSGEKFANSTRIDDQYLNCNDGYVSTAKYVVNSGCKIYNQPRIARISPVSSELFDQKISEIYNSGSSPIDKSKWINRQIGFVYSSCDENASLDEVNIDPCAFSSQESKKIPRIFLGCATDGTAVKSFGLARGIIKAPPSYFHSIIIGNTDLVEGELEDGDIVNVVFDLSSGERISKSLEYSSFTHGSLQGFIEAFGSEILSDENIVNADIEVAVYAEELRIDVYSDTKFSIFAGQTSVIDPNTGDYVKNNKVYVVRDSKYTFDFEITKPAQYDDINRILNSGATHMLFLDGKFKGMAVSFNKKHVNGKISIQTCPRVTKNRTGLGAFVVDSDINCVHVAFISKGAISEEGSTLATALPFVVNKFGEVTASTNPVITSSGFIGCQGLIDGKWQIFGYFPSLPDTPWVQLTFSGENRNLSAASDSYGNVHMCWETDRYGYTSVQYACIGPSSRLINRLALSGLISKSFTDELYEKTFQINPIENALNFIESNSSNIKLVSEKSVINFRPGGSIGGGSFDIAREFTGNIRIENEEFDYLRTENASTKLGSVEWPFDVQPNINNGAYCTSYIIHFEQKGTDSGGTLTNNFTAYFSGKILRVFTSSDDLSYSQKYFQSSRILYPLDSSVSVDNNSLIVDGLVQVAEDEKTLYVSINYTDSESIGPIHIRVLVEGVKSQSAIEQSNWNRIFSNNGKVSIPEESYVCVECAPKYDCAIGSLSVCQDHNGYYFTGQESEFNISAHADCSISPKQSRKIEPLGQGLRKVDISDYQDLIERNGDYSYSWTSSDLSIFYVQEFSGQPGFNQARQYSSGYRDQDNSAIVSFLDTNNRYFPGFDVNSYIQSFTISVNAGTVAEDFSREIWFDQPILALYVDQSNLEQTDIYLGNGSVSRSAFIDSQRVKITVSKYRNKITIYMPSGQYIDFSIRVVVSSREFEFPFSLKNDVSLEEEYLKFESIFNRISKESYQLSDNIFNIDKTEKRFDEIIPLIGLLRFDDLNINPNSVAGNYKNLMSIYSTAENIDTSACVDISSLDTYKMEGIFKIDGDGSHLHDFYIVVVPEKISFIAKNSETLDEYVNRTSNIGGYREAIIKDIYTGYAKVGIISKGVFSSGKPTSISLGTVFKLSDYSKVEIGSDFSIQIDAIYNRLSDEDRSLILSWSHVSKDAFYPSSSDHPNYHLQCNVFINDMPVISHNTQVDMSDKNRQWDVSFGSPFGSNPSVANLDASFLELMSGKEWEIIYSGVRIGNPRISIRPEIFDNSFLINSRSNISRMLPNSDSNIGNEKFEQSLIDPGDWVCLEHGNLMIDGWEIGNGGAIYVGEYINISSTRRSVLLEACFDGSSLEPVNYYSYPQYKSRRSRISSGQFGGISQEVGTSNVGDAHTLQVTTGIRPIQESLPKISRIAMVKVEDSVFTYRHRPASGEFIDKNSSLDFKSFRSEFYPSSSDFNIDIRNVSENINKTLSYFTINTITYNDSYELTFSGHTVGALTKDVIFYIDQNGALKAFRSYGGASSLVTEEVLLSENNSIVCIDSLMNFSSSANQNPFCIAVTSNGSLKTFTYDETQNYLPNFALQSSLPSGSDFNSISIGYDHACALKEDGSVVCWGSNTYNQISVPSGHKFVSVKAGQYFTVGIKEDGSLLAWGINNYGQTGVPSGKFIKIDLSAEHGVGIKFDNSVVSWGRNAGTINLQDPSTKFVDVAACGGNVYALSTYPSTSVVTHNVLPFNVGIDINGNVVAWGKYNEAFTLLTSREKYHEAPSVPCVAIKRGIRSCILMGIDGKIYAYGIAFGPSAPNQISNLNSIYRKDIDYFSGGMFIESVYIYANSNLIEEDENISANRLYGISSNAEFIKSYGIPDSVNFYSIPLVWKYGVLQKSSYCHIDVYDKCSIIWEDNLNGKWNICESSNIWLDRSFTDSIYLSNNNSISLNPSLSSDDNGVRAAVWTSKEDDSYYVKIAYHNRHPDYVSECDIDKIISSSRLLGFDVDPYDPYNVEQSLMSCRVDISFTAPEFGNYFFNIIFKDIDNENIIYKQSYSKNEPGKWFVNERPISYDGQVISEGETVKISFVPDSNDDVYGKVLKVDLNYSTEETADENMLFVATKSTNVYPGDDWWFNGPPGKTSYPVIINGLPESGYPVDGEYLVFSEAAKNSSMSISAQDEDYFNSQGSAKDSNFIFPSGVSSLRGFESGTFVKSFLFVLGDDGSSSTKPIEATLTFNQPIVAVITDEFNLRLTDREFRDASSPVIVDRKNIVTFFQFYEGEYIRLGEDGKTLYVRFNQPRKNSWPGVYNQTIITSRPSSSTSSSGSGIPTLDTGATPSSVGSTGGTEGLIALSASANKSPFATFRVMVANYGRVSGQITTTYFCASPIKKSCKISTTYGNFSSESKNVHFKITVYSDAQFKDALMSFSSKTDSRIWSSGNSIFPSEGILIASNSSGSATFSPPVINLGNMQIPVDSSSVEEQTRISSIYNYYNLARNSMICGVKYYIIAEATVDNDDIEISRFSFVCGCDDYLSDREDAFEWNSPKNNSTNTTIAKSVGYIGAPNICSTDSGLFGVSWEDSRSSKNLNGLENRDYQNVDIYFAIYNSKNNIIDSSFHSGVDRIVLNNSSTSDLQIGSRKLPVTYCDIFGNFTVMSSVNYNSIIKSYLSVGSKILPTVIEESAITKACSFTLTDINRYSTAFEGGEFMQIRVADKHVVGYKNIESGSPAPIVNDCFVDFEVVGIPGATAYRIKNESESEFTDWIPINTPIQPLDNVGKEIDVDHEVFRNTFKGRWIGNDIFALPWVLSKSDGIKRVCMEVLTAFGKTQEFCIDLIAEYSKLSYVVEIFLSDSNSSQKLFKPARHKGIPVVNRKTYYKPAENGQLPITISREDIRSLELESAVEVDVYVQVTFDDPNRISRIDSLNKINAYASRRKDSGQMQLIMYQQGNSVQTTKLILSDVKNGIYYGTFKVKKNNGVTDKDGLAFVFVDLPSECLNPFVKDFTSILRIINDPTLDKSSVRLVEDNVFIEKYNNQDKRNAFGRGIIE
jgi:hypothetical protein